MQKSICLIHHYDSSTSRLLFQCMANLRQVTLAPHNPRIKIFLPRMEMVSAIDHDIVTIWFLVLL